MTDILSVKNMRLSDAHTIKIGTPGTDLMLRAAKGIFDNIKWKAPVAIICGSGNNGGDGYALALLLHEAGIRTDIIRISEKLSEDGAFFFGKCTDKGIPVLTSKADLTGYATIVDCMLGTGFKGKVRSDIADIVERINISGAYIVSVDINSGLNGDSGLAGIREDANPDDIGRICVRSDITVSIGSFKPGHYLGMAKDVIKDKVNVDIGIEPFSDEGLYHLMEQSDISSFIPDRANYSNKGSYGYTALLGGSLKYSGAIRLAYMASAAMRSGAGVVRIGLPASLSHDVIPHILESTLFPMSDNNGEILFNEDELSGLIQKVRTVAFGMGIGISDDTFGILTYLLQNYSGRLIIDADGLTILSGLASRLIKESKSDIILTPHLGEFSRLCGKTISEIEDAPIDTALDYVKNLGRNSGCRTVLLLKGPTTVITDGTDVFLVDRGCPGMATAGSGDVLSGILAATCSYIPDLMHAVATGAYIGGLAGELAGEQKGDISMIASDTVAHISQAIQMIRAGTL